MAVARALCIITIIKNIWRITIYYSIIYTCRVLPFGGTRFLQNADIQQLTRQASDFGGAVDAVEC